MLERIKSTFCRIGRKTKFLASAMAVSAVAAITTIAASAEETAATGASAVINSAGEKMIAEFTNLATTVTPIIVTISIVGLGIYAVIYLFKIVKQTFSKAAG